MHYQFTWIVILHGISMFPSWQMTPEPIPLPNQSDMKTNAYLSSQKPASAQSIESEYIHFIMASFLFTTCNKNPCSISNV